MDSYILGCLNVAGMALAFSGRIRKAACLYLVIQVPWSVWDCATHNYGFLLIGAGSAFISITTLVRRWRA